MIVVFHGERLHGRYALFKLGKGDEKDWMIHRMDPPADPDAAGRAPRQPQPGRCPVSAL